MVQAMKSFACGLRDIPATFGGDIRTIYDIYISRKKSSRGGSGLALDGLMAGAEALTAALRAPARISSLRCHCRHRGRQLTTAKW